MSLISQSISKFLFFWMRKRSVLIRLCSLLQYNWHELSLWQPIGTPQKNSCLGFQVSNSTHFVILEDMFEKFLKYYLTKGLMQSSSEKVSEYLVFASVISLTHLTIRWVDNLGEKSSKLCHISIIWWQLIHIETLGMERCHLASSCGCWTIVLKPVTIQNVTIAYLEPF